MRWVQSGAPEGDPADRPARPTFADDEWILGEPDLVVTLEEVPVPAGKSDVFPKLIGRVMLPEDRWIQAVEFRPGNRKVLHHIIAFQVKGFGEPDLQGGWLGAWAAGTDPMVFPPGTGRLLQKGANILADMHYHPVDTDQKDVTRIGIHFVDGAVNKELVNIWVQNDDFEIPAGAKSHQVVSSYKFWQSGKIMGLIPHMHYRGADFKFTAYYPDGRQEVLLSVPRWDFNWQTNYELAEPLTVPAGTRVECIAHYDNSPDNPVNPDPTRNVPFGLESYDEMMIGFVDFVVDDGIRPKEPQQIRTEMLHQLGRTHPGEVYAVHAGKPEFTAPLYLPKQGDGVFFVIFDGQLIDARVSDIQWNGTSLHRQGRRAQRRGHSARRAGSATAARSRPRSASAPSTARSTRTARRRHRVASDGSTLSASNRPGRARRAPARRPLLRAERASARRGPFLEMAMLR